MPLDTEALWKELERAVETHSLQYERHEQTMVQDIVLEALRDEKVMQAIVNHILQEDAENG